MARYKHAHIALMMGQDVKQILATVETCSICPWGLHSEVKWQRAMFIPRVTLYHMTDLTFACRQPQVCLFAMVFSSPWAASAGLNEYVFWSYTYSYSYLYQINLCITAWNNFQQSICCKWMARIGQSMLLWFWHNQGKSQVANDGIFLVSIVGQSFLHTAFKPRWRSVEHVPMLTGLVYIGLEV